jgi:hypothetical protein
LPARQDRRDGRRFGKKHMAVDGDGHDEMVVAASEDKPNITAMQGIQTKI